MSVTGVAARNNVKLKDIGMLTQHAHEVWTGQMENLGGVAKPPDGNPIGRMQVKMLAPKAVVAPPGGLSVGECPKQRFGLGKRSWRIKRRCPIELRIHKGGAQPASHRDTTGTVAEASEGVLSLVQVPDLEPLVRTASIVFEPEMLKGKDLI